MNHGQRPGVLAEVQPIGAHYGYLAVGVARVRRHRALETT
jgi:hypothetical protein